jgi:hypothetical protein
MKLVGLQDIYSSIVNGDFSNQDLEKIIGAVKFRRSEIVRLAKRSLTPGSSVKFTNPKTGQVYFGTVDKIKVKYVLVKTNLGRYNVPANLLETV